MPPRPPALWAAASRQPSQAAETAQADRANRRKTKPRGRRKQKSRQYREPTRGAGNNGRKNREKKKGEKGEAKGQPKNRQNGMRSGGGESIGRGKAKSDVKAARIKTLFPTFWARGGAGGERRGRSPPQNASRNLGKRERTAPSGRRKDGAPRPSMRQRRARTLAADQAAHPRARGSGKTKTTVHEQ